MDSLLYKSLKQCCICALGFYFKKWEIKGASGIPEGPVIFVPNHQNAFLDAILVTCSSDKAPWYLTRANVFNNPKAAYVLNALQMLPVYRFRDGFATLKKNDQVFEKVVQKLENNESILIFAEGSHSKNYNLGPLQKGVARIAISVSPSKKVAVVPVGLQYDSPSSFRSRVLVSFGSPITFETPAGSQSNTPQQMELFLDQLRNSLQPLMLHIESNNYEERWNYLLRYREYHHDLNLQLKSDQLIIAEYPMARNEKISNPAVAWWRKIMMGYIKMNSLIPYFIIHKLLLGNIKDPQFIGSVKFAAGMFLAPLFWALQAFLLFFISGSPVLSLTYFISLPLFVKLS